MEKEAITNEIQTLFEKMGCGESVESVEVHEGATSRFSVRLRGDANLFIGERGGNLSHIEHLIKKIIRQKSGEDNKFTLDINDYRMRRLEDLKQDVKTAAKEVRLYRREVPLHSMSSFERRIVHLLLAEYPDITTESIGEEPGRYVIIKPYP